MGQDKQETIDRWTVSETASDLYEDLLNRYERVLLFAGHLQQKSKEQKLLAEKNDSLNQENERLRKRLALEESYVRLLENSLQALGVLKTSDPDGDR